MFQNMEPLLFNAIYNTFNNNEITPEGFHKLNLKDKVR